MSGLDVSLIDVRAELEHFDWANATWSDEKLIAASPFRHDNSPSFYVYFTEDRAGFFGDSGAYDDDFRKGGIVKLLSFLRNETTEETLEYLDETYGTGELSEGDKIVLPNVSITPMRRHIAVPESVISDYDEDYTYLLSRGIDEDTQRKLGIKYNSMRDAIAIPWRHANGILGNIKYRKTRGKAFWYESRGAAIRELVYCLDLVYAEKAKKVYICEAEIDAASFWTMGFPAIALGTSSMSPRQAELIAKSPIESIVIATDDDEAGDKVAGAIHATFNPSMKVTRVKFNGQKDANAALMIRKGLRSSDES
jgi:hypothetical protein